MTAFVDCLGREWGLCLTFANLPRVRDEAGLDLVELSRNPEALAQLLIVDSDKLPAVGWILAERSAKSMGFAFTREQFFEGLDAAAMDRLTLAILEEWCSMFRRSPVASRLLDIGIPAALEKMSAAVRDAAAGADVRTEPTADAATLDPEPTPAS